MLIVGWAMGVPCRIAWYHTLTSQVDLDASSVAARARVALLRLRKRFVYRLATQIAAVSSAAAEDVQRHFAVGESRCRVVHNSLADPAEGMTLPAREPDVVVCAGRLYPSKGQAVVIEALGQLKTEFPSLRIHFLGHGPSLVDLVALAAARGVGDRCTFFGKLSHADVLTHMATAQAVIVPSRSEAFGMVTIEALAMGTPVIATATGGTLDIVRDGVEGFLFPPDDAGALADRLRRLLAHPDVVGRLGANARARFVTTFEQRRVIGAQSDWIESLTSDRPPMPSSPHAAGAHD
jgi:glycosyltransferase involved in cell wall biosynthesis